MFYEDVFRHTVSEAEKLGVDVFPTIVHAGFEFMIQFLTNRGTQLVMLWVDNSGRNRYM